MSKILVRFCLVLLLILFKVGGLSVQAATSFELNNYQGIFISEIHFDAHALSFNNECNLPRNDGKSTVNKCTADKWFEITNWSENSIKLSQLAIAKTPTESQPLALKNSKNPDFTLQPQQTAVVSDNSVTDSLLDHVSNLSNTSLFKNESAPGTNILSKIGKNNYQVNLFLFILNPDISKYESLKGSYSGVQTFSGVDTRKSLELCWDGTINVASEKYFEVTNNLGESSKVGFYGTPGVATTNCQTYPKASPKPEQLINNPEPITSPVTQAPTPTDLPIVTSTPSVVEKAPEVATNQPLVPVTGVIQTPQTESATAPIASINEAQQVQTQPIVNTIDTQPSPKVSDTQPISNTIEPVVISNIVTTTNLPAATNKSEQTVTPTLKINLNASDVNLSSQTKPTEIVFNLPAQIMEKVIRKESLPAIATQLVNQKNLKLAEPILKTNQNFNFTNSLESVVKTINYLGLNLVYFNWGYFSFWLLAISFLLLTIKEFCFQIKRQLLFQFKAV